MALGVCNLEFGGIFSICFFPKSVGDLCVSDGSFGGIFCWGIWAVLGKVLVYIFLGVLSVWFICLGDVGGPLVYSGHVVWFCVFLFEIFGSCLWVYQCVRAMYAYLGHW